MGRGGSPLNNRPDLLILCLDGADLHGFDSLETSLETMIAAMPHRRPLESTIIPQTPVAWTSFLCGADPRSTGVWGWMRPAGSELVRLAAGDLPRTWQAWEVPTLFAGLPFLENAQGPFGTSLGGLRGPTKAAGGSRPHVPSGVPLAESIPYWEQHHARWSQQVVRAYRGHRLVIVHCDVIDWFSHRFSPADRAASAIAWALANQFAASLSIELDPRHILVVSDHGSAPLGGVVLIHEALHRAGLAEKSAGDVSALSELLTEPAHCRNDYGAVWCRDVATRDRAVDVLLEVGATRVEHVGEPGTRDPTVVGIFPDGWITLVPPELYPKEAHESPPVLRTGPHWERIRQENWHGDHARTGLLGTDSAALFAMCEGAGLQGVKQAVLGWLRARA